MSFAEVVILSSQQIVSFEKTSNPAFANKPSVENSIFVLLFLFSFSCLFAVYTNSGGVCFVNTAAKSDGWKALGGPHNLWVQSDAKSDVLVWRS